MELQSANTPQTEAGAVCADCDASVESAVCAEAVCAPEQDASAQPPTPPSRKAESLKRRERERERAPFTWREDSKKKNFSHNLFLNGHFQRPPSLEEEESGRVLARDGGVSVSLSALKRP